MSRRNLLVVVVAGFTLVVLLLMEAAYLGYRGSWSIHSNAQQIIREHLVQSGRGAELEARIERESQDLVDELVWILGFCSFSALACAVFTILTIHRSLKRLEWQSDELQRVSWHMVENHEDTARRFSHEMHDEVGQTLTGLKGLLKRTSLAEFETRRAECIAIVDEALESVRELSQLLRPVILDDLGLDAAMQWLIERFKQRTGVEVSYTGRLEHRLSDSIETQIFRIAQEALTNIARHSGATRAAISLVADSHDLHLMIVDWGIGYQPHAKDPKPLSLGMIGMRARARRIGGKFTVQNVKSGGLRIEVIAPTVLAMDATHEENSNFTGR